MCGTHQSTHSRDDIFIEMAFPIYQEREKAYVKEHDCDWVLLR